MTCSACGAVGRQGIAFCEECGASLAAESLGAGVDLNYATVEEINAIPGVHMNAAKAIVEFRQRWGPFTEMGSKRGSVERVTGVGPKTWAALQPAAFVGPVRYPLDINSAPGSWLALANGVSRALGDKIVAARPFASMDDVGRVAGVGPAKVEALKAIAAVLSGGATTPAADLPHDVEPTDFLTERPDVVLIRFRAEEDGTVTKVVPDHDIEIPFEEPYRFDRGQILAALQQSVVPFSHDPALHAEVGQQLTNALFGGMLPGSDTHEILRLHEAARSAAKPHGLPVTFQLSFDEGAMSVAQLPWELLGDDKGLAIADERIRLNRYITYFGDREPFEEVDPLRVLYVESRPKDQGKLPNLSHAYFDSINRLGSRVQTDLIESITFDVFARMVGSGGYQIVHFDGHGTFDPITSSGYLAFEDGSGGTRQVSADELAGALEGSGVRLVVLGACQGATVGGSGMFQATAPALIRAGVPAVVANQFSVYTDAMEAFISDFYASIARGESISAAVADGRKAMAPHRGQFFLPTLYLRVADGEGYLFSGEPETHRRWRMTEMQKVAAWWLAMSELQRALYREGVLRWRGVEVQPRVPAEPSLPDIEPQQVEARDRPRDSEGSGGQQEQEASSRATGAAGIEDLSGTYEYLGQWAHPLEVVGGYQDPQGPSTTGSYQGPDGPIATARPDDPPLGAQPRRMRIEHSETKVTISSIDEPHVLRYEAHGEYYKDLEGVHRSFTGQAKVEQIVQPTPGRWIWKRSTELHLNAYFNFVRSRPSNEKTAAERRSTIVSGFGFWDWESTTEDARQRYEVKLRDIQYGTERWRPIDLIIPAPLDDPPIMLSLSPAPGAAFNASVSGWQYIRISH